MRPRKDQSTRINPVALVLAALAFLCLPALLAFAGADTVPTSQRAKAAVDRTTPRLKADLTAAGLTPGANVFLQITKQPGTLTAYVEGSDGKYTAFRTWPVCAASGDLGPKLKQGDRQSPEGFYNVRPGAMNPVSSYHLSFNLGYPNAFDRAHGRTGDYLMVHGNCVSVGCYAMTDPVIEEVWTLMQLAYENGQSDVPVHIFPFPMTAANLQRHAGSKNDAFWRMLAPAWVQFEETGQVPQIKTVGRTYQIE